MDGGRETWPRRVLAVVGALAMLAGLARVTRVGQPRRPSEGGRDAPLTTRVGPRDLPAAQEDRATLRGAEDAAVGSVRDRAVRERVRAAIVRAWSPGGASPTWVPPPAGAPIPARAGALRPEFIRDRVREDFLPMAQVCYASLLARRPGVEGRVSMEFEIVADANHGGIVEDARILTGDAGALDAGVWEGEFLTCMRESMMTVAFLRPEGEGRVTVRYPFNLRAARDGGG